MNGTEFKQHLGLPTNTIGGLNPETEVVTLDSKDLGQELNGRRLPDPLPPGSFQELPEAFNWLISKLDNNPQLTTKIIELLSGIVTHLGHTSLNFELFTQAVSVPKDLDNELLRTLSISPDAIKKAAIKIGFSIKNSMHMDTYYITLLFLYYYGCRIDHSFLRELCLTLICVKLYRGRIYRYWKNGSDNVTTKYVITNKLRTNNLAKLYPNTFDQIILIWAPRLDKKYSSTVKEHPAHHLRGIISILIAAYARIEQVYIGLAKHYYLAFYAGHKTGIMKPEESELMVERDTLSHIELYTEAVYDNMIFTKNPVSDMDRTFINSSLKISQSEITRFENYIENKDNQVDVKDTIETLMHILKPASQSDLANMHIIMTANEISAGRSRGHYAAIKDKIDNSIKVIHGSNILGASPAQILKLRKCYILLYLLKIKQAYSKRSYYFETNKLN